MPASPPSLSRSRARSDHAGQDRQASDGACCCDPDNRDRLERDPEHQKDLDEGAEITSVDGSPYEGMVIKVRKEDMLGHRKLLIDTIIKQAQMLKPKTYGPKLDLTSGGEKIGLSAELEAARKRSAE
jgi:hypothetical protein